MSIPTSARTIVLQNYAREELDLSPSGTFGVKDIPIPSPIPEDSLLVQVLYLSNDAGVRLYVRDTSQYEREDLRPRPLGTPFYTFSSLGRVLAIGGAESESGTYKVGDIVEVWYCTWADYVVTKKANAFPRKQIPGVNITAYLGAFGISGATAYWALKGVLKPKETDTLVVSGAAGSVGHVAVQLAKKVFNVKRVVGIAGTDEKCRWLKTIGADEAVNYKNSTFVEDLAKATPEKVDLYYDSVGGSMMDVILMRMKLHGVICLLGATAHLEKMDEPMVMKNFGQILFNRLTLKGFTLFDYVDRIDEAIAVISEAVTSGKVVSNGAETIVDIHGKVEEIPRVWNGLFSGTNTGKLITKLAD